MRDGFIRRTIKRAALAVYLTDLGATRLLARLKGEPAFRLGGSCGLCARCCETPSVQLPWVFFRLKSLRALFIAWHRHVNGFELIETEPRRCVLVFKCGHFDPETRRCDSYDSRPGMCRDYPRNLLYHAQPDFFDECGYHAINKKGESFEAALERAVREEGIEIDEANRRKIDEVFYLEKESRPGDSEKGEPEARTEPDGEEK